MTRITWTDLPDWLQADVLHIAGADVVAWRSQTGGFSRGTADVLTLADGRRVFLKAVSGDPNPDTPDLHRREARVAHALPASCPAPRLLGSLDRDGWVALVFEAVDGRPPLDPWQAQELRAVFAALDQLAASCTPCPLPDLPGAPDELRGLMEGWEHLAVTLDEDAPSGRDTTGTIDPEVRALLPAHLDELRALASRAADLSAGTTLVHLDARQDNLLVEPDGRVVIVDWPWACVGCDWLDSMAMLINAEYLGVAGYDAPGSTNAFVSASERLSAADPENVDALLAGFAGYFVHYGRLPDPPGIPAIRAFQRAQGRATLRLLARRRAW